MSIATKNYNEDAGALHQAEKFFSGLERKMFKIEPPEFDLEAVKNCFRELQNAADAEIETEFRLKQELHRWRRLLAERDEKIETYHLRRFCEDSAAAAPDPKVFAALVRFYHSLPHSAAVQSKFDYVVTRLCSRIVEPNKRRLLLKREELLQKFTELFNNWDGKKSSEISAETSKAAARLDEFIAEAKSYVQFEEIVKRDLFNRLRVCKRELGEQFYEPAVIAAAVECNVVVGNVFARLLRETNEKIGEQFVAGFDFAQVFHDAAPNAAAELLGELRAAESAEEPETAQVYGWLKAICQNDKPNGAAPENDFAEFQSAVSHSSARARISPLAAALAAPQPDEKVLRDYLQNSSTLNSLDLTSFLDCAENSRDVCRRALELILWANEICENELSGKEKPGIEVRNEISQLQNQAQMLSEKLRQAQADEPELHLRNVLLYASSQLLETRLRLERAVIQYSTRNLERTKTGSFKIELPETKTAVAAVAAAASPARAAGRRANPWLAALAILIALGAGGYYFFSGSAPVEVAASKDVEVLNVQNLPGGENLKSAHRQNKTLFVTASDSWKTVAADKQKENLQAWLQSPTKTALDSVVVTDGNGQPLGSASPKGVQTFVELEAAAAAK